MLGFWLWSQVLAADQEVEQPIQLFLEEYGGADSKNSHSCGLDSKSVLGEGVDGHRKARRHVQTCSGGFCDEGVSGQSTSPTLNLGSPKGAFRVYLLTRVAPMGVS